MNIHTCKHDQCQASWGHHSMYYRKFLVGSAKDAPVLSQHLWTAARAPHDHDQRLVCLYLSWSCSVDYEGAKL